jgi:sugar phosphate isomerase/epimerase
LEHLKKVIDFGVLNNIKVLVFGCPRNRKILKLDENNDEVFCAFFRKLGEYIGDNELKICIEPNSKQYGCNYINTIKEAGELVTKVKHPNIKMMVDIGNAIMENDNINDIYNYKDIIHNIDVANENMSDFRKTTQSHKDFVQILKEISYKKKINLEMLIQNKNNEEELDILYKSLYNFILL